LLFEYGDHLARLTRDAVFFFEISADQPAFD